MFRELSRSRQQLTTEDCIELLKNEKRGVLSVIGDHGYPYGMPMNHFYNESEHALYFHCGKTGHRLDALRQCDRVSFCVYDQGTSADGDWALTVQSVIVFGRIEILDDPEQIAEITARLSRKFTQDETYIREEIRLHAHKTLLLRLIPEHLCGKLVKES